MLNFLAIIFFKYKFLDRLHGKSGFKIIALRYNLFEIYFVKQLSLHPFKFLAEEYFPLRSCPCIAVKC